MFGVSPQKKEISLRENARISQAETLSLKYHRPLLYILPDPGKLISSSQTRTAVELEWSGLQVLQRVLINMNILLTQKNIVWGEQQEEFSVFTIHTPTGKYRFWPSSLVNISLKMHI